jgi:hypothetical protein
VGLCWAQIIAWDQVIGAGYRSPDTKICRVQYSSKPSGRFAVKRSGRRLMRPHTRRASGQRRPFYRSSRQLADLGENL